MNGSLARPDPRRGLLIAVASALIVELGALIYLIYAYPRLWGDAAIGICVFAAGMLIPWIVIRSSVAAVNVSLEFRGTSRRTS